MDEISLTVLLSLTAAAFFAGWIDAVVGGGGLVQLPALMVALPQAAPVYLLATNKFSSACGTIASAATYVRRVRPDPAAAIPLVICAFIGSTVGAMLASMIPKSAFSPLVLAVLLSVGAYTLWKPSLGSVEALRHRGLRHASGAGAIGVAVGIWDGALGPGTGSFFVFLLVGVLGYAFLNATALAKLANLATNLAALVVFIPQNAVLWQVALPMGLANVVGGYLGARAAVSRGHAFVRAVFIVVLAAFILKIGADVWQQFFG
ncbi:sulfite exporter TauE/SafE family protein [Austwickia chelonae]|uniref:sulfite exporter TauE/SafE family protein n=1 Tax=Austwickia chelonae TaxID=100225 RepID=UPI000E27A31D|nr:TSUP family transporter [Austwickia chelonae]